MTTKKPSITPEAQHRIRSFVHEVEALQERWGVQIATDYVGIVFRDSLRKEEFVGPDGSLYGESDASVNNTEAPGGF
jgi:hypothetical protein